MLLNLIFALQLHIIFSENPSLDCNLPYQVGGCYSVQTNSIVISYYAKDQNFVLYHELGHRLFNEDSEVKAVLSHYPSPRIYPDYAYPTDEQRLNEKVADYASMYFQYSDFGVKFPKVKELFDARLLTYK